MSNDQKVPYEAPPPYPVDGNTSIYPSVPPCAPPIHYEPQMANPYQPATNYPTQASPPQQATYIIQQPAAIILSTSLGPFPTRITCSNCQQTMTTRTNHVPGLLTWLLCGGMALFQLYCCCCIPFCIDSCQDVEHRCSNCRHYIGTYKRM